MTKEVTFPETNLPAITLDAAVGHRLERIAEHGSDTYIMIFDNGWAALRAKYNRNAEGAELLQTIERGQEVYALARAGLITPEQKDEYTAQQQAAWRETNKTQELKLLRELKAKYEGPDAD